MNMTNADLENSLSTSDGYVQTNVPLSVAAADWSQLCPSKKLDSVVWQRDTVEDSAGGSQGGAYGLAGQWIAILNQKAGVTKLLSPGLNTVGNSEPTTVTGTDAGRNANATILNSMVLHQTMEKELAILKQRKNALQYINDFIRKVLQAVRKETAFAELITGEHKSAYESTASLHSESDLSDDINPELRTLPKLGKVYAELRTCMKTADEICNSQPRNGLPHDFSFVQSGIKMKRSSHELKGKMLLHVRWLIEARLANISQYAARHYDDDEHIINLLLLSNDNKRFCKLIEVYNEYATRYRKCLSSHEIEMYCGMGRQFAQTSQCAPLNGGVEAYGSGIADNWSSLQSCAIYPLSMKFLLDMLSGGFLRKTRDQVSVIMDNCMSSQTNQQAKHLRGNSSMPDSSESIWGDASRIEVRPVHPPKGNKSSFFRVIKRVAGVNVPDLNMEKAAKECYILNGWFSKQEHLLSTFTTGLHGKTKLLRRSYNFQDSYLSDDTMSVASSENLSVSSRRQNETKSVKWRDSWGNEAVKSVTNHYHEFLLSVLPVSYGISYLRSCSAATLVKYPRRDDLLLMKDIDNILLHSVISNLAHLNVLDESVHKSLQDCSTAIVISCALSASDSFQCEMMGKCSSSFDKVSAKKLPDCGLTVVSKLCILSLHPLMYIMEMHAADELVSKDVLARVEAILTGVFWWIKKKIQEFFSSWNLSSLVQICMSDLREVTNISLDCLRLVESCHNHIESNRNSNSAALHLATQHLQNIDSLITNMQVTSGSCMERLGSESYGIAYQIMEKAFPPHRSWLQRHAIDTEAENVYVQELINSVVTSSCNAVKGMDSQSQLAGMTPIITAIYDSCLAYIGKCKVKFSVQGGLQLSYDFSAIINYVTADISGLSPDVKVSLSSLHSVKRALHVADLLQSTYEYTNGDVTDKRFRPRSKLRSSTMSLDEPAAGGEFDDNFWLSLRRQYIRKSKTWTSFLPCVDSK